jgi:hypothetical protein
VQGTTNDKADVNKAIGTVFKITNKTDSDLLTTMTNKGTGATRDTYVS